MYALDSTLIEWITINDELVLFVGDATISLTVAWAIEAVATRTYSKIKERGNTVSVDVLESLGATETGLANMLKCISLGIVVAPFVT